GRVLWALSDRTGVPAKRFAELDPPPSLEWLEVLTEQRFRHEDLARFGIAPDRRQDDRLTFSFVFRPTPYTLAPLTGFVSRGQTECQWDPVTFHLARWLTKHIENPKLLLWVAKNGGILHSNFARLIQTALDEKPPSVAILTLWHLVLG